MPNHDYGFQIGDRVIVTSEYEGCPAGEVGIVTCLIDMRGGGRFEPFIVCKMESDGFDFHECTDIWPKVSEGTVPGSTKTLAEQFIEQNGYRLDERCWFSFSPEHLKKFSGVYKRKIYTCDVCGVQKPISRMVRSKKGKYVCNSCLDIKSYSTRNNTRVGRKTKAGWTFGFEFECVPKSKEDEAVLVSKKWGFVPTSDSSLPSGGVELKSPTINGRSSLKRMFMAANDAVDFSSDRCGQHINIGNPWMDETTIGAIRSRGNALFYPLEKYMTDHRDDTERVCGRYFKHYCETAGSSGGYYHGVWLNLDHGDRVEFRISKFVTPDQYFNLTNMWVDMLDAVHSGYLNRGCSDKAARETGRELVKIFQQYAEK